jgi:hypothetical protein
MKFYFHLDRDFLLPHKFNFHLDRSFLLPHNLHHTVIVMRISFSRDFTRFNAIKRDLTCKSNKLDWTPGTILTHHLDLTS